MTHPNNPICQSISRTVLVLVLLTLAVGLTASPAMADSVGPPPPPLVDIPPPPPVPATIDPSEVRHVVSRPVYAEAAPVEAQPVAQVQYQYGDAYGFTAWLNGIRAQYGRGPVGYDANLEAWAQVNNGHQSARGMGHHVMGSARRQNAGMGAGSTVWTMWLADPPHAAALLDPTITMIGIAASGAYWTYNAY